MTVETAPTNDASTMVNQEVNQDLTKVNSNQSHGVSDSQASYQALVASRSSNNMI